MIDLSATKVVPRMTRGVSSSLDPAAVCRKRRRERVEILQLKRQRPSSPSSRTSSSVSASSCSIASDSTAPRRSGAAAVVLQLQPPCFNYTLTKEELRRKKNRESAERSRQKKLSLIDDLALQACELQLLQQDLDEENQRLRALLMQCASATSVAAAVPLLSAAGNDAAHCCGYSSDVP